MSGVLSPVLRGEFGRGFVCVGDVECAEVSALIEELRQAAMIQELKLMQSVAELLVSV